MHEQLKPFTSETARAAAMKAVEAKRRRKARALLEAVTQESELNARAILKAGGDEYIARRLARVREAIDRYDDLLLTEMDPQKANWLAGVVAKLSDLERVLAGRPAPGNYRPATPRRRTGNGAPTIVPE